MPGWIKKTISTMVVVFLLFFIVTKPDDAASVVHSVAGAGQSVIHFFQALAP